MPLSKAKQAEYQRERRKQLGMTESKIIPKIPLYNPSIHRIGDTVKVLKGKCEVITIIPALDADGNLIPEY